MNNVTLQCVATTAGFEKISSLSLFFYERTGANSWRCRLSELLRFPSCVQNSVQLIGIFKNIPSISSFMYTYISHHGIRQVWYIERKQKWKKRGIFPIYKLEHFVCFLSRLSLRNKRNEESNLSWCSWDTTLYSFSFASPLFPIFLRLGESFASRLQRFSASLLSHLWFFFFLPLRPQLRCCTFFSLRISCN